MDSYVYRGYLDTYSVQNDSSNDEELDFFLVGNPKYQLGLDEKDHTLFSINNIFSWMTNALLDRVRDNFNIKKSIRLIPYVPGMSWSNLILGWVTLCADHLFVGLRNPLCPHCGSF